MKQWEFKIREMKSHFTQVTQIKSHSFEKANFRKKNSTWFTDSLYTCLLLFQQLIDKQKKSCFF